MNRSILFAWVTLVTCCARSLAGEFAGPQTYRAGDSIISYYVPRNLVSVRLGQHDQGAVGVGVLLLQALGNFAQTGGQLFHRCALPKPPEHGEESHRPVGAILFTHCKRRQNIDVAKRNELKRRRKNADNHVLLAV